MVNVSEALIKWLGVYAKDKITTDSLGEDTISIGLFKTPQQSKKEDILGNITYDDYYTYTVRLDSVTDVNMIKNQEYMQSLSDWIEAQNNNKKYPDLKELMCLSVDVSTPFCMGVAEEHSAIYQLTIHVKYRKEIM